MAGQWLLGPISGPNPDIEDMINVPGSLDQPGRTEPGFPWQPSGSGTDSMETEPNNPNPSSTDGARGIPVDPLDFDPSIVFPSTPLPDPNNPPSHPEGSHRGSDELVDSPRSDISSQDSPPEACTQTTTSESQFALCTVENPRREYDKYQRKTSKGRKSEQRVLDGKVLLTLTTLMSLADTDPVMALVRREPSAARNQHSEHPEKFMRENEFAQLEEVSIRPTTPQGPQSVNRGLQLIPEYYYEVSINLDSVFLSQDGKEVYKLVKSRGWFYNHFELHLVLKYSNGWQESLMVYDFWLKSGRTTRGNPDSGVPRNPDSGVPKRVQVQCNYLEADEATIKRLNCPSFQTSNHDIAYYYLKLKPCLPGESRRRPSELQRGDVVAFIERDGETYIDYLTAENSKKAFLAGVISRTAFLKGRRGICRPEKDDCDLVCIIGEVDVKVAGPVKTGELIYSCSSEQPGTAVAESRVNRDRTTLALGMATQSSSKSHVKLVPCLVSVVLGMSAKDQRQSLEKIHNMKEEMEKSFEEKVIKIQNCWKGVWKRALAVMLFLLISGALCYIFLAPNSPYLVGKCEKGCIRNKNGKCKILKFDYLPPEAQESDEIDGLHFTWARIKNKLDLKFDKHPNVTGMRYFLNKNRCVTGSIRAVSSWLDPAPRLPRINVLAVDINCSFVYYHSNSHGWVYYHPDRLKVVECDRVKRMRSKKHRR